MTDPLIPLFKVRMNTEAALPALTEVLESGHVAQGPVVDRFEMALERALGLVPRPGSAWMGGDVVTVNSGTSALHLAMVLAGVERGTGVIVSPMTCAATIAPIIHLGAIPIWADVDPMTGLLAPEAVDWAAKCAKVPIRAVVGVDWAGVPCDYAALRRVVPGRIPIIEDAAHAMLATRPTPGGPVQLGVRAAADNMFVCYSLQAIKHLTSGDGGILICPTPELTVRARQLRWFGLDRRSSADFRAAQDIDEAGYKYHLNDIAAAIGLANLPGLAGAVAAHRENARAITSALFELGCRDHPRVELVPFDEHGSYWVLTLLVDDRPAFEAHMKARGIATSQVHRRNDHQPAFARVAPKVALPGLDRFAARQIAIPCGWWLTATDRERIIDAVASYARAT